MTPSMLVALGRSKRSFWRRRRRRGSRSHEAQRPNRSVTVVVKFED
jgi:hypothetical protein